MQIEVSITADDTELAEIVEALSTLEDGVEVSVGAEEDEASVVSDLSETERYALAAVQETPGSALRVIHRHANEFNESPFDGYSQEDGWNDEREDIQSLLWSLKSDGLVRNEGQQWYPTDDAPENVLQ